jgi:hypothetical protein
LSQLRSGVKRFDRHDELRFLGTPRSVEFAQRATGAEIGTTIAENLKAKRELKGVMPRRQIERDLRRGFLNSLR